MQQFKKFNYDIAILNIIELEDSLLQDVLTLDNELAIFHYLIEKNHHAHAIQFLACGLPKREAIWWAYLASDEAEHALASATTQAALKAIFEWVKTQDENLRLKAEALSHALGLATPTSWAAEAVFLSGGNIAHIDNQHVEPDPYMCNLAAANALIMASHFASSPLDKMKQYLKQGLHIAMGGNGKIIKPEVMT